MNYRQRNLLKIILAAASLVIGLACWVHKKEEVEIAVSRIIRDPWKVTITRLLQGPLEVTTLNAGNQRKIHISAGTGGKTGNAYAYAVEVRGQIVSRHFIDFGTALKFKLLYSKDKNLVGLVKINTPHILNALYDFSNSQTWAAYGNGYEVGKLLKGKLQKDHPSLALELVDDADRKAHSEQN